MKVAALLFLVTVSTAFAIPPIPGTDPALEKWWDGVVADYAAGGMSKLIFDTWQIKAAHRAKDPDLRRKIEAKVEVKKDMEDLLAQSAKLRKEAAALRVNAETKIKNEEDSANAALARNDVIGYLHIQIAKEKNPERKRGLELALKNAVENQKSSIKSVGEARANEKFAKSAKQRGISVELLQDLVVIFDMLDSKPQDGDERALAVSAAHRLGVYTGNGVNPYRSAYWRSVLQGASTTQLKNLEEKLLLQEQNDLLRAQRDATETLVDEVRWLREDTGR